MFGGKKFVLLVASLFVSSFFIFSDVFSASTDIVINEVASYPTSTHEWVEIWNKGTTTIDLTGWKFWEGGMRHTCSASTTDYTLEPSEYAVIVQDKKQFKEDFPWFNGSIFDSSWGSLNEGGEEIGMEDKEGVIVEKFVYPATKGFSLERKNPFLNDYSLLNWQEHAASNTMGFLNTHFSSSTITSTPREPTSTPDNVLLWSRLRINEVVPNPEAGEEWIEIFNPTTSTIQLDGGVLCDNRAVGCVVAATTGTILAQGWVTVFVQGNKLNNSGDSVILKSPSSTIVDQMSYGGGLLPKEAQAVARRIDGVGEWVITTALTPGATNTIVSPPTPSPPPVPAPTTPTYPSSNTEEDVVWRYAAHTPVVINELFPNPVGSDIEGEFVELKNISNSTVVLDTWKLRNSTKAYGLNGELKQGEFLLIPRIMSGIVLKNSGEEIIRLVNGVGEVASEVRYTSVVEGESYGRFSTDMWKWSLYNTPGEENEFVTSSEKEDVKKITTVVEAEGVRPENFVWNLQTPSYVIVGEAAAFSAAESVDVRGGEISYVWNIENETILFGEKVSYVFSTSGLFSITVIASSTVGTVATKKIQIPVGIDGVGGSNEIIISEVFPAPNEKDQNEFIELFNSGTDRIDVGGWNMQVDKDKIFIIPTNTIMVPGAHLVFYKPATKLTLNNKEFSVELFDNHKNKVDEISVSSIVPGKSFSLIRDTWYWDIPNPHKFLFFPSTPVVSESAQENKIKEKVVLQKKTMPLAAKKTNVTKKEKSIVVQGVVVAIPGTFSSQFFYIANKDGGVQVYQNKKDFPELVVGDVVEVKGVLSGVDNLKRIIIPDQNAIEILDIDQAVEPTGFKIVELEKAPASSLVEVVGEITEIKTTNMYVDDGAEVSVVFKKGAKIDKKQFVEGGVVKVVGVLERTTKGLQILPRSQEDIIEMSSSEAVVKPGSEVVVGEHTNNYTKITFGGIGAIFLGWLARARGLVMVGALKGVGKRVWSVFKSSKDNS